MESRYKLDVQITIAREERHNGETDYWHPSQERISVNESLDLGGLDFVGITGVMGALHDAVHRIRDHGRKRYPACQHHPNAAIERYEPCPVPGCQDE